MDQTDYEELQEFRRQDVLHLMRELSEDCWAAGWNSGLEHDLYLIVFEGMCPEYGMGEVSGATIERMRRNATLSDSWWVYPNDKSYTPVLITLDEARRRFSKLGPVGDERFPDPPVEPTVQDIVGLYEASSEADWVLTIDDEPPPKFAWGSDFHEYGLKSNLLVSLCQRDDRRYDLRYGYRTIKIVTPTWATTQYKTEVKSDLDVKALKEMFDDLDGD